MNRATKPADEQANVTSSWWSIESTGMLRHGVVWALVIMATNLLVLILMVNLSDQMRGHGITDHFDDPSLPVWENPDSKRVSNGVLQLLPGDESSLKVRLIDLSFTVNGRRPVDGSLIVSYRAGDAGSYQIILKDNDVSLNRFINGKSYKLVSAPVDFPDGNWIIIHIITRANLHSVSLDGKTILRTYDDNPFDPGTIKLGFSGPINSTGEYDDLELLFDLNPIVIGIKPSRLGGPLQEQ